MRRRRRRRVGGCVKLGVDGSGEEKEVVLVVGLAHPQSAAVLAVPDDIIPSKLRFARRIADNFFPVYPTHPLYAPQVNGGCPPLSTLRVLASGRAVRTSPNPPLHSPSHGATSLE